MHQHLEHIYYYYIFFLYCFYILFINMKWPFLSFLIKLNSKSVFCRYENSYSCFFWDSVHMINQFLSIQYQSMAVFACMVNLLQIMYSWLLFLNPFFLSLSFNWRVDTIYILFYYREMFINSSILNLFKWDLSFLSSGYVFSSSCSVSFSISCSASLVIIHFFSSYLFWKVFISLLNFDGWLCWI